MSLIYIFIALARRLGLDAAPVEAPYRVLAHIASPIECEQSVYIDVYQQIIVSPAELRFRLADRDFGVNLGGIAPSIAPSNGRAMLLRTTRNIFASFSINEHTQGTYHEQQLCQYAAACASLMVSGSARRLNEHIYSRIDEVHPLDLSVVLRDKMVPAINDFTLSETLNAFYSRKGLERGKRKIGMLDEVEKRRSDCDARYFVGQIVKHTRFRYIGCILSWTVCGLPFLLSYHLV